MFGLKRYGIRPALLAALPLLGLALGTAACTDGDDPPGGPDAPVQVGFTISARAEAGDGHYFEQGTGAEYALHKDNLHFYLFDNADDAGASKLIAAFTPTSVSPAGTNSGSGTGTGSGGTGSGAAGEVIEIETDGIDTSWYVEGELTADVAKKCAGGFRFVVLANVGTGLDTTQPDLRLSAVNDAARWWTEYGSSPIPATGLPMYGCRRYTAAAFRPEMQTDLGEINLLRAVTKIELVWVSSDYELQGNVEVHLPGGNDGYFLAPKNPAQETSHDTSADWFYPWTSGHSVSGKPDSPASSHQRHLVKVEGAVNAAGKPIELYRCYLPEYRCPEDAADAANFRIGVKYKRTETAAARADGDASHLTGTIFFADYNTAAVPPTQSTFDLVRNHIYRFTVSVNDSAQPSVAYEVCPWEEGSAEIEFD